MWQKMRFFIVAANGFLKSQKKKFFSVVKKRFFMSKQLVIF